MAGVATRTNGFTSTSALWEPLVFVINMTRSFFLFFNTILKEGSVKDTKIPDTYTLGQIPILRHLTDNMTKRIPALLIHYLDWVSAEAQFSWLAFFLLCPCNPQKLKARKGVVVPESSEVSAKCHKNAVGIGDFKEGAYLV